MPITEETKPQAHPEPRAVRSASRDCPRCGKPLYRLRRRPHERLLSVIYPVKRYKCKECGWRGLLRAHS